MSCIRLACMVQEITMNQLNNHAWRYFVHSGGNLSQWNLPPWKSVRLVFFLLFTFTLHFWTTDNRLLTFWSQMVTIRQKQLHEAAMLTNKETMPIKCMRLFGHPRSDHVWCTPFVSCLSMRLINRLSSLDSFQSDSRLLLSFVSSDLIVRKTSYLPSDLQLPPLSRSRYWWSGICH